jgi:hypothetical protein
MAIAIKNVADCEESYPEMREARSTGLIVFAALSFEFCANWLHQDTAVALTL